MNYYTKSFLGAFLARITSATVNFLAIPILLKYLGDINFGIITLANSVNAYIYILDMGINTGAVRFLSDAEAKKDYRLENSIFQNSCIFYSVLGLLNTIILLGLAQYANTFFSLKPNELDLLKKLLRIMAAFSIINWLSYPFQQWLIAIEKIYVIKLVEFLKSIFYALIIFITVYAKLSTTNYFILSSTLTAIIIVPYAILIFRSARFQILPHLISLKSYMPVLVFSIGIFVMSIFQTIAEHSRAIILAFMSSEEHTAEIQSIYQIIGVFPGFVLTIFSSAMAIILPQAVKKTFDPKNQKMYISKLNFFAIALSLLIIPQLIFLSKDILLLYVGEKYAAYSFWMQLKCFALMFSFFCFSYGTMVLALGKTKHLIVSSMVSCITSILINILLFKQFGVGSAIIAYLFYLLIQFSYYLLYIGPQILGYPIKNFLKILCILGIPAILLGGVEHMAIKFLIPHLFIRVGVAVFLEGVYLLVIWFIYKNIFDQGKGIG